MKNWQADRNYRKIKNADGTTRNIITVDGVAVEVSENIYEIYSQMDRSERYEEEKKKDRVLSLDRMSEDELRLEYLSSETTPSAEDAVMEAEEAELQRRMIRKIPQFLSSLTRKEQRLVKAIYYDGISMRAYAKQLGITHRAVQKQRDQILKKLEGLLIQV